MAIRFVAKEPDPKPVAEKVKKAAAPVQAAVESADGAKPGRAKAKKPAKDANKKDGELF
jgi:hypothetical protein